MSKTTQTRHWHIAGLAIMAVSVSGQALPQNILGQLFGEWSFVEKQSDRCYDHDPNTSVGYEFTISAGEENTLYIGMPGHSAEMFVRSIDIDGPASAVFKLTGFGEGYDIRQFYNSTWYLDIADNGEKHLEMMDTVLSEWTDGEVPEPGQEPKTYRSRAIFCQ